MNSTLRIYNRLKDLPGGKRLFSFLLCRRARYFSTIHPLFRVLEPGRCEITMKFRKSITNHLGTVHAIAMCNLVELAGGICVDVSLPKGVRWIPKGMNVEYLALGKTELKAICSLDLKKLSEWNHKNPFPSEVILYDSSEKPVMKGTIQIHLSENRNKE